MGGLWKWGRRLVLGLVLIVVVLLVPVAWVETSCRGDGVAQSYGPIITDPEWQRAESRSYLTYPEWHIVHAYDDYARVIRGGDPHDYHYFSGIQGFWSSLCALSKNSGEHGGVTWASKQTIYTIGVSFTAELTMKALYEETIGRLATWLRGPGHTPLDDLSAGQAAAYAKFLQQVPWYKWDFAGDIAALKANNTGSFRDQERAVALGLEFGTKAKYADVIAAAVASVGVDQLRLRLILRGVSETDLAQIPGVTVIARLDQGLKIETPRYRELTHILDQLAQQGAEFVEIAGNDDIMLTAISSGPYPGALYSFKRQGYGDMRHLISVKVVDLANTLRGFADGPVSLEHIHDY